MSREPVVLRCCSASSCRSAGSERLSRALLAARANGEAGEAAVLIRAVGCLRLCGRGPLVARDGPRGTELFGGLGTEQAADLLAGCQARLEPHRIDLDQLTFQLQEPDVDGQNSAVMDGGEPAVGWMTEPHHRERLP
ncbi:(2Fe-2S) ferredoxin domain-containing protein [Synechococcus sp. CBW1002]|uniref:(2Fe-2S) ferredoxin domain-containing protein n=1 Tax=Synechococcus sp. CBW1002 TaxID=1353134 RepID=UPI0018CF82A0|nr:(2Fe-2S) ferredoxin domain-containing protein [Synechococcus sp. CBW1002]QPN58789.1 (2Fe-2S) ferredoxin domain-containing protein [Synechococcus sp. CBW1002]